MHWCCCATSILVFESSGAAVVYNVLYLLQYDVGGDGKPGGGGEYEVQVWLQKSWLYT